MNNFFNIGILVKSDDDYKRLMEKVFEVGHLLTAGTGKYVVYTDRSCAEVWVQINNNNEVVGLKPHFKGESRRIVCLTHQYERNENELDGAFHCWADPQEKDNPQSGVYPFVFDVPDIKSIGNINFPKNFEIQLSAFTQQLTIFETEQEYKASQSSEPKYAGRSFIPLGLFSDKNSNSKRAPEATTLLTGIIRDFTFVINRLTEVPFCWILVDTLGGEIDVVADVEFIESDPVIGGVVQGRFWLSGQLINPPGF